jgi:uncharacterized RDD family membrane protein YckC
MMRRTLDRAANVARAVTDLGVFLTVLAIIAALILAGVAFLTFLMVGALAFGPGVA